MRAGAAARSGVLAALLLAVALASVIDSPPAQARTSPGTLDVDVRLWQDVRNPLRLYISARPAGAGWEALGTARLLLDGGLTGPRTERFGDVVVDGVELRVWQDLARPLRLHVGARARGGDWEALPRIPLPLDDGHSRGGHYRYGDITLHVPPAPGRPAVSVSPAGGEVPRLASLTVTFREAPPRGRPEALVAIEPPAPGSFAWLDDRTLLFQPDFPGWERGRSYRVRVDAARAGLASDHVHRFTAGGRLEVAHVIPGPGDVEVPARAQILVQFSRAVAPLTVLREAGSGPVLAVDPPLAGTGEWLNTSLYRFIPEELPPDTEYRVRIPAALTAEPGSALASDYAWSFSTVRPAVSGIGPPDRSLHVEPDAELVVTFNQPMDRGSVEAGVALRALSAEGAGDEIAAAPRWSGDGSVLTLVPDAPLALGGSYELRAAAGLKGARGSPTLAARSARFEVVHPPMLATTSPAEGEREAPCCSLRLTYNNPMDPESFPGRIFIDGEPVDGHSLYARGDSVSMWGVLEHSREHTVRIAPGVRDRGGRALPGHEFSFTVRPPDPSLRFTSGPFSIWQAGVEQQLEYVPTGVGEVRFRLHRLTDAEAEMLLRRGFVDGWDEEAGGPVSFEPSGAPLREWSEETRTEPGGAPALHATPLGPGAPLAAGHYLLHAGAPELPPGHKLVLSVVDTTLLAKLASDELLVWALDYASGEPLAGVEVRAGPAGGGARGPDQVATTGADGLARFAIAATPGSYWNPYGHFLARIRGDRTGVVLTWWDGGGLPRPAGIPSAGYFPGLTAHLYTDRPLYRPGETVFYRGVVRWDDDASYSLPAPDAELTVTLRDPRYGLLEERAVEPGAHGSFSAGWEIPPGAPTGRYRITLRGAGGRHVESTTFTVAEFRLPELSVEVEAGEADYVSGEAIAAETRARFFFGGPAAEAGLSWAAHSSPTVFSPGGYERYSFSEHRRVEAEPLRARGESRTDAEGIARFQAPSLVEGDSRTQLVTVSATVTDVNGQAVAGSTTVTVHPAAWYAGIRAGSYVAAAGEPQAVELITLDTRGRVAPLKGVTVRIAEREWVTTLESTGDGDYRYRSEQRDTVLEVRSLTTDAAGEAELSFTPPSPGRYVLTAEATDGEGRVARAALSLWASGPGSAPWRVTDGGALELVADRESYRVGEVARVLVPAPFSGVWGLVTTERGRVLSGELRRFPSHSEVLQIPIEEGHLPNVYVGVVLYRPPTREDPLPRYRIGYVNLPVSTEGARLEVRIEPDRERALPGERVRYEVEVHGPDGRGVPAELSVAVVDEALLSLAGEAGPDGLGAFWSERALGVRTAWSLAPAGRSGPVASAPAAVAEGDLADALPRTGGEGEGAEARVRSDFRHAALWVGSLQTDARGRASVELELPDNATTWRARARAVTQETLVGEGESDLLVSKPLLVRPALPRFLRVGDEVVLRALVRNGTTERQRVSVSIEAAGVALGEASTRRVSIDPGDSALVGWPARALSGGRATVTLRARAGSGPADAVEISLPVHPSVTPETTATGGVVEEAPVLESLYLPEYVPAGSGSLEISLQGALVGALEEELPALAPYPRESAVRLASRIVAAVAVSRATGLDAGQEAQLRSDVDELLETRRHDGWAWCRSCQAANVWVTGWALAALGEARAAGYEVPEEAYAGSVRPLLEQMERESDVEEPADPNRHAFLLYALTGAGGDLAREQAPRVLALATGQRAQLASWGRAYALLALLRSGHEAGHGAVRALLNDLSATATSSANGSHWEDGRIAGSMHDSAVRATALVLRALAEASPDHPLIEETARWLVLARAEDRWKTSVERAQGMASLGAFAELTGERRGVYDYRVLLGARLLLEGRFDVPSGDRTDGVAVGLGALPSGGVSRLQLEREPGAEGRMYYRLHLRYATPARGIEALSRGFAVSHRYSLLEEPGSPVARASVGDIVRVTVTVIAPSDRLFARVEDLLPAGLEPIDPQLAVVPEWLREQLRREQDEARVRQAPGYVAPWHGWYYSPWDQVDLRDDRLVLLASRLPAGVHEYVYYARATTPGDFFVAPPHAEESYFPEVFGRGDSSRFSVVDGE